MRNLAVAVSTSWTTEEAIELAKKVEAICPLFGYHVALTGGLLYKEGPRKDCDLVLYQIRNSSVVAAPIELLEKLKEFGFGYQKPDEIAMPKFVQKAFYNLKPVDLMFPEFGGEY